MWMPGVNCAVNNLNLQVTCSGSALLQETYGPYVRGKSRNAQTKPMTSSCCSKRWYRDSLWRNQKYGQWCLGEFGMHGIEYILREFNPPQSHLSRGCWVLAGIPKSQQRTKEQWSELIRWFTLKINSQACSDFCNQGLKPPLFRMCLNRAYILLYTVFFNQ